MAEVSLLFWNLCQVDWPLVRELAGETNGDRSGTVGENAVAFDLPGVGA